MYITNAKSNAVIKDLAQKCKVFEKAIEKVKNHTLDPNFYRIAAFLLHKAGQEYAATDFLKLQPGGTEIDVEIFADACNKSPEGMTRCTTFGCSDGQINHCFNKVNKNNKGEITNSPGRFIIHPVKQAIYCLEKELESYCSETDFNFSDNALKSLMRIKILDKSVFNVVINDLKNKGLDVKTIKASSDKFWKEITDEENEKKGIVFGKSGLDFNGVKYARHILDNFTFAITPSQRIYIYENGVWRLLGELELSRMLMNFFHKDLNDSWTPYLEKTYLEPLKRLAADVKEMDCQKQYINVLNGMLDIERFMLYPHRPDYYSTIQIPLKYDPNAKAPKFVKFLDQIFEGDQERVKLTLEIMGLCLTAEMKAQKAFVFWGKGANGKSVLSAVIKALCGDANVSSVPMKDLDNSFARSEIVGKILNLATENEFDGKGLNSQYFKSITTGDPIRVEEKFKPGFTFTPICKLLFCLNKLPYCSDHTYGFLRRLIIVPFTFTVDEKNDNKNLVNELLEELPGILNLSLEALARLRKNKYIFTKSRASDKVLTEYREEINPMEEFVNEYISAATDDQVLYREDIRKAFDNWCFSHRHNKIKDLTDKRFWSGLRDIMDSKKIVYKEGTRGGKRCFKGISIKNNGKRENFLDEELQSL